MNKYIWYSALPRAGVPQQHLWRMLACPPWLWNLRHHDSPHPPNSKASAVRIILCLLERTSNSSYLSLPSTGSFWSRLVSTQQPFSCLEIVSLAFFSLSHQCQLLLFRLMGSEPFNLLYIISDPVLPAVLQTHSRCFVIIYLWCMMSRTECWW